MRLYIDSAVFQNIEEERCASIAQLGERQTEDLKALCSIHSRGILSFVAFMLK
jgi:hypothetical protein